MGQRGLPTSKEGVKEILWAQLANPAIPATNAKPGTGIKGERLAQFRVNWTRRKTELFLSA